MTQLLMMSNRRGSGVCIIEKCKWLQKSIIGELEDWLNILSSAVSLLINYYFLDLGLRNSRINFRQFEQTHVMENPSKLEH